MAKRSPRLIFTEEERALPELERAVRKADRAAVKLEKAEAKIPKKAVKVKKRVVDSESGKVTTRLFFEEADKKRPPSRLAHAARKAPLDTVRSAVHRKLREEGGDNPGTEAANTLTETAERTWRIAESAHRSHAEKLPQSGQGGSRRRQSQSQGAEQTVRAGIRQGFQPLFPLAAEAGH
mgnify:FL=1